MRTKIKNSRVNIYPQSIKKQKTAFELNIYILKNNSNRVEFRNEI